MTKFGILGPLLASPDGTDTAMELPAKQRIVLACLLLSANRVVPLDRLIQALWDEPPRSARITTQGYVKDLRSALGDDGKSRIVTTGGGYRFVAHDGELDLHQFGKLRDAGTVEIRAGNWADGAEKLREALTLWRGEPLLDVPSTLLQREEVPALTETWLQVTELRVTADLTLGRHDEIIAELRTLAAVYPLREKFHEQLMLALYRCGLHAEAIDAYHRVRRLLATELGIDPGPQLRDLHQRMLSGDPELRAASPPSQPVTLAAQRPVSGPAQLPPDLADFTGRDAETEYLCELFSGRDAPGPGAPVIVTISGLGGVGKTALAVHAAHRLAGRFSGGHLFADLRGAGPMPAAADEVLGDFLRALGVSDAAIPSGQDSRAALFRGLTADRRLLIVLDNAVSAAQVRPLLPASASCGVIVTGRRRLTDLAGSTAFEADVMPAAQATAFLAALAGRRTSEADDAQLAVLAQMCGYLPLALRIVGARLAARPAWTIGDLTARLADGPRLLDELTVGDLAVRAAFDMSYQLLEPGQARAFRLLSIADLDDIPDFAAAALLRCQLAEATSLAESLVDLNLLTTPQPGRYAYHDLVRVFAREMADKTERPADLDGARRRLLSEYRRLASHPPTQSWLRAECRNIVAQIIQAAGAPDADSAECAAILAAAQRALRASGHLDGWRRASAAVLDSADRSGDYRSELTAQQCLAQLAILSGDTGDAEKRLSRALELARDTADRSAEGYVLNRIGLLQFIGSNCVAALESHRAALEIFEELNDRAGICTALVNIGKTLVEDQQAEAALQALRRVLDMASAIPDRKFVTYSLHHMARAHASLGNHQQAMAIQQECLQATRDSGDREGEAYALAEIGRVWLALGQPDQALASLSSAVDLFTALGATHAVATFLVDAGRAQQALGNHTAALAAWREALPLLEHADPVLAADVRQRIHDSEVRL